MKRPGDWRRLQWLAWLTINARRRRALRAMAARWKIQDDFEWFCT